MIAHAVGVVRKLHGAAALRLVLHLGGVRAGAQPRRVAVKCDGVVLPTLRAASVGESSHGRAIDEDSKEGVDARFTF